MDHERVWVKVRWVIPSQPGHFAKRLGWMGDDGKHNMQVDSLVGTYLTMVANKALGFYIQHQINHTIMGIIEHY